MGLNYPQETKMMFVCCSAAIVLTSFNASKYRSRLSRRLDIGNWCIKQCIVETCGLESQTYFIKGICIFY